MPKWLETKVAGRNVKYVGIHDSRNGYYLIGGGDCDGAHRRLTLTRDRRIVANEGYKVVAPELGLKGDGYKTLQEARLPLSTGKGVRIGDTPRKVVAKLGNPTRTELSGSRKQFVEFHYDWNDVKNGEGVIYGNTYVFKAGRLIEISLVSNSVPG